MLLTFSLTPFLLAFYILVTWAVCAAALIGLGGLLLRPLVGDHKALDAFWAGLFVAVGLLQLAHFFVPISWPFSFLFSMLGAIGLLLHREMYFPPAAAPARKTEFASLSWSLLVTFALALRCVGPCNHYDTGFYGAMAVRWFNTYPLVPGLANLMAQIGFNSSVFLCVATLNHGLWNGLAFHLFPGLLLSALTFAVVPAFCRLWRAEATPAADTFLAILVMPLLFWVTNSDIIGTNTDLPATFTLLMAFFYLLAKLQTQDEADRLPLSQGAALLVPALLFPLAVSFKISSIFFAFLGWLLIIAQIRRLAPSPQRRKLMFVTVLLPAVLLGSWIVRGIVLSGYPFFPSSSFGAPVDWRVPRSWVDFQAYGIRHWARKPWSAAWETEGWHWLRTWIPAVLRDRVDFIFPAMFSFAGILVLLRPSNSRAKSWLVAMTPPVCGLIFWFWRAPAIRFGEPAIWSIGGALGAAALLAVVPKLSKNARQALLVGFVLAGTWCSYPRTIWRAYYLPAFQQKTLPRLPQDPVAPYTLNSHLTILVPYKKNQCWDAPLPCSPRFYDSLRLRQDSDLRFGFSDHEASGKVEKSDPFHKLYWNGPEPTTDN